MAVRVGRVVAGGTVGGTVVGKVSVTLGGVSGICLAKHGCRKSEVPMSTLPSRLQAQSTLGFFRFRQKSTEKEARPAQPAD